MSDKQNPNPGFDELPTSDDERAHPDKSESGSKSYYYDDSTGYEIYEEQSEEDEQFE